MVHCYCQEARPGQRFSAKIGASACRQEVAKRCWRRSAALRWGKRMGRKKRWKQYYEKKKWYYIWWFSNPNGIQLGFTSIFCLFFKNFLCRNNMCCKSWSFVLKLFNRDFCLVLNSNCTNGNFTGRFWKHKKNVLIGCTEASLTAEVITATSTLCTSLFVISAHINFHLWSIILTFMEGDALLEKGSWFT